ncbi:HAMP domain-containing sensor histidine kinase [Proteocatella sphenisci]|uniref:HAMP domain-containing sensor histidine kinase n=1 Tax=Proteocatella sphenisci TaxID=181070 RepID=UPI00048C724A|nr:ATP-binding protein [Proteocatella sphenisci]
MFKSIRWKLSILYFVLVFIAMAIVGIFITDRLEDYNLDIVRQNLVSISNNTIRSIIPDSSLPDAKDSIQDSIDMITLPIGYSISIVDSLDYSIIASSNDSFTGKNSLDVLDRKVIMSSLTQKSYELDIVDPSPGSSMVKIMAFSFINDANGGGYIIYSSASLEGVYASLNTVTDVFLTATLIALFVSLLVGFLISGSITTPINELNAKASLIAKGDFSQRVTNHSNDEIGMLGNTFNYLTKRLDNTLVEISSEKSKLDAIINNMADGLMALDEHGFIVLYNKALLKLLKARDIDIYGSSVHDMSLQTGVGISFSAIKKCIFDDNSNQLIINAGDEKILRVSPAYYSDDAKKQTGFILVFQDITDAQRLENMRKDFVANVSHELKTPITTIKSYAETLSSGIVTEPETVSEFLMVIENEADRMTSIVRDLLQLSHFDFKKAQWNFEHNSINDIIRECIEHLKIYYIEKNQTVNFTTTNNPNILVDKAKIKQVILNILSNAIKYTPEFGNVDISVDTVDNFVDIYIRDDGLGIPEEDLEQIFERFYRVDKGRSRQQGGTGLGLSIARDIVIAHGGKLKASSEINKGSIFKISLPVDKSVANPNKDGLNV